MIKSDAPNCVLFRIETGQVCIVLINEGKGDWDHVQHVELATSRFDDVSIKNPFEWVFCYLNGDVLKSSEKKSVVKNSSFCQLYEQGVLQETIEMDYKNQFSI